MGRIHRLLQNPWLACSLVLLFALILGLIPMTSPHGWGDDFAGYLLQARALIEGRPGVELSLNGELMRASDWRVGPDGYPWGFPAILAATYPLTGWNLTAINGVGLVMLGLVGLGTWLLARRLGLRLLGIITATALTLWQPRLIDAVGSVASDLPFLAVSLLALLATVRLMDPDGAAPAATQPRLVGVFLAAVLGVLAFAIRSNGAVVLATIGFALVVLVVQSRAARPRALIELAAFCILAGLGVVAYFQLPDGSLVHVSYLSLEPASMLHLIGYHFDAIGLLVPINLLPNVLRPVGVLALAALCLGGAWRLGAPGLTLLAYLGGHLLLMTVFKFEGGMRYYFPLLPVIAILAVVGARHFFEVSARIQWAGAVRARVRDDIVAAGLLVVVAGLSILRLVQTDEPEPSGPWTPASQDMMRQVQARFPASARVSFFKPRLLRWTTGREGVLIRDVAHVDSVDGIVLHPLGGPDFQLTAAQVESSGQFDLAYSNPQFQIYTRKATAPSRSAN